MALQYSLRQPSHLSSEERSSLHHHPVSSTQYHVVKEFQDSNERDIYTYYESGALYPTWSFQMHSAQGSIHLPRIDDTLGSGRSEPLVPSLWSQSPPRLWTQAKDSRVPVYIPRIGTLQFPVQKRWHRGRLRIKREGKFWQACWKSPQVSLTFPVGTKYSKLQKDIHDLL